MQHPELQDSKIRLNIVYPTEGTYDVKLRTKNTFGNNTMLKEDYIVVGNVSVKDMSKNPGMIIYPNPSRGEVKVRLLGGMEAWGHGSMEAWVGAWLDL